MPNEDLIKYIKENREKGFSDDVIKKALLDAGWKEEDINDGFNPASVSASAIGKLASAPQLLKQAFKIYAKRPWVFIGILIIPAIIIIVLGWGVGALLLAQLFLVFQSASIIKIIVFVLLAILAIFIIGTIQVWSGAALMYAVKDHEEKIGIIQAYKRGWKKIFPYWGISALMGIIILGGYLFFLVPGLIFSVWFCLTAYVLIAEDVRGMNALMKSRYYIRRNGGKVVWRFIFLGIIITLISLVLGLLDTFIFSKIDMSLITTIIYGIISVSWSPVMIIYMFSIYKSLKDIKSQGAGFVPVKKTKNIIVIVAILGFVLVLIAAITGLMKLKDIIPGFNDLGSLEESSHESEDYSSPITDYQKSQSLSHDVTRVGDLFEVAIVLDRYYNEHGNYPVVPGCSVANWNSVVASLKNEYTLEVPVDPINSGNNVYMYAGDGNNFVIRAYFENSNYPALVDDPEGNVLDCFCDDPAYCLTSIE